MDERTGVYSTPIGQVVELFGHRLRVAITLGEVEISAAELRKVQIEMEAQWAGMGYHVLNRNCNHFCDALAQKLDGLKVGSVRRTPSWVNRLAALFTVLLSVSLVTQRCWECVMPVRWGGRRYSQLGSLAIKLGEEAARTSSATGNSAASEPRGKVIGTPIKLLVPPLGDKEVELQRCKMSELRRRAEAAGVSDETMDDAIDSGSPKRQMIALIVAAEDKPSSAALGEVLAEAVAGARKEWAEEGAGHTAQQPVSPETAGVADAEATLNESLEVSF